MPRLSRGKKLFKTAFLIACWICIGLNLEIVGPTLKDLKILTNTNYEDVSRAASGRAFGFFIGAAIGGFLVERFDSKCDLLVALSLDLIGGFGILAPHVTETTWLFVIILMQGTFEGVINIAGQKLLLEIWRENSASPMHALHLGFGVGSLIVPQIAEPFLAITSPPSTFNVTESANSFTGITAVGNIFHVNSSTFALSHTESFVISTDNQTISNYLQVTEANVVFNSSPTSLTHSIPVFIERSTRIKWAFLIVALIAILISFMFFYFQFFGTSFRNSDEQENSLSGEKKEPEHSILQKIDPKTCTSTGSRAYGIQILTLLFLFCFQVFGGEYIIGKFIRSYAIDTYNMEGDEASWLNTCFWISYTVGCFIGFIAGKFVSIRLLLLIECVGLLASTLLFAIFAGQSETMLWIFTQLLGAFDAPAFPICIVWGDNHMKITGFGLTVISFGGSMGGFIYLWVVGHFYDTKGPESFQYSCLALGILTFVIGILLHLVSLNRATRFEKNSKEKENSFNANDEITKF